VTPTIFIILGITGDLAGRKLLPSLLSLYVKKELPKQFAIVGFSRRPFTREEFRTFKLKRDGRSFLPARSPVIPRIINMVGVTV
jgi:glucose-6-phosphate 1-dehydrogenase